MNRRKIKARKRDVEFKANQERERQINQRIDMERIADDKRERHRIKTIPITVTHTVQ
jgi:hypothetical protein